MVVIMVVNSKTNSSKLMVVKIRGTYFRDFLDEFLASRCVLRLKINDYSSKRILLRHKRRLPADQAQRRRHERNYLIGGVQEVQE